MSRVRLCGGGGARHPQPALPSSGPTPALSGPLVVLPPRIQAPSPGESWHPSGGEGTRAASTPRAPSRLSRRAPELPALCQLLGDGAPAASGPLCCPLGKPRRIWGLAEPVFQVPGLATRELRPGHRENPERLRPGHPSSPSRRCPWLSLLSRRAEVRPAQPRGIPTLQKDQRRGAEAQTPPGRALEPVGRARAEAPGAAPADRSVSRLRLRPWPLSPAPGRVFHSTVWLGEVGDVLGAQGAGFDHKSPCGTSFPLLTRACSWPPRFPGYAGALLSGSGPGDPEAGAGLPHSPKGGPDRPIQCHHLPNPPALDRRWPGPQRIAARGGGTQAGNFLPGRVGEAGMGTRPPALAQLPCP